SRTSRACNSGAERADRALVKCLCDFGVARQVSASRSSPPALPMRFTLSPFCRSARPSSSFPYLSELRTCMIPLDLSGKIALVTGVGDNVGFAWFIAKALQAAGARLVFACHPRLMGIVESILQRDADADTRVLPFGAGNLKVEKVLACDVSFDTMADVDEKTRNDRRYQRHGDYSIQGMMGTVSKDFGAVDILIHSIAFSPEITKKAVETSRQAYLTALSVSSYSLTALLRAAQPLMENRPG